MCSSSVIGWPRKRRTRLASQAARTASRSAGDSGRRISRPPISAPSPAANGETVTAIARLLRRRAGGRGEFLDRHPPVDAVLLGRVVARRLVVGAAVVPDDDVALPPLVAVLPLGLDHVAGELLEQRIAFLRLQPLDPEDLAGVEIERFAPGFGMRAQDRVADRRPVAVFLVEQLGRLAPPAIGEE